MKAEKLFNREEYENNLNCLVTSLKAKDGVNSEDVLRYLTLSQITRAADALEEIASMLSLISDCVEKEDELISGRLRVKR